MKSSLIKDELSFILRGFRWLRGRSRIGSDREPRSGIDLFSSAAKRAGEIVFALSLGIADVLWILSPQAWPRSTEFHSVGAAGSSARLVEGKSFNVAFLNLASSLRIAILAHSASIRSLRTPLDSFSKSRSLVIGTSIPLEPFRRS